MAEHWTHPAEFASQFFQDTGQKKSTNWTRLRDAVAARDAEAAAREAGLRAQVIEECAQVVDQVIGTTLLAARIRALAALPEKP